MTPLSLPLSGGGDAVAPLRGPQIIRSHEAADLKFLVGGNRPVNLHVLEYPLQPDFRPLQVRVKDAETDRLDHRSLREWERRLQRVRGDLGGFAGVGTDELLPAQQRPQEL